MQILKLNYSNMKPPSKRVLREQTNEQSALSEQIVYNTKSDIRVFNMAQRYIYFIELEID